MTKLSVNINKVATLRNARGGNVPDVIKFAMDCERFGAQGITVHPRPDERHIRYNDVYCLKEIVKTEFNIEGYPDDKFMKLVLEVKPHQVTLVPDPPGVLTSNAGWDTQVHQHFLKETIGKLKEKGIRTSIFVDTNLQNIEGASKTGTDRIELYTEPYAAKFALDKFAAVFPFAEAAKRAIEFNLGINAGHDLNHQNLKFFCEHTKNVKEVSIGHALISDALYWGIENTIQIYLRQIIHTNEQ